MAAPSWAKEIFVWFAKTFGKDIILWAKDALADQWQRLFASRNILILGPKGSGKSSLMLLMTKRKPYDVVNGEIQTPDPTVVTGIVDKKVSLQHGNWLKLKKDVPGDPDLRETWKQAIDDLHPNGIIYMLDGRRARNSIESSLDELWGDVLANYQDGPRELQALHIFLNFADTWATNPGDERSVVRALEDAFEARRALRSEFQSLRFRVAASQLSPNRKTWNETERALHHFGADLKE